MIRQYYGSWREAKAAQEHLDAQGIPNLCHREARVDFWDDEYIVYEVRAFVSLDEVPA